MEINWRFFQLAFIKQGCLHRILRHNRHSLLPIVLFRAILPQREQQIQPVVMPLHPVYSKPWNQEGTGIPKKLKRAVLHASYCRHRRITSRDTCVCIRKPLWVLILHTELIDKISSPWLLAWLLTWLLNIIICCRWWAVWIVYHHSWFYSWSCTPGFNMHKYGGNIEITVVVMAVLNDVSC